MTNKTPDDAAQNDIARISRGLKLLGEALDCFTASGGAKVLAEARRVYASSGDAKGLERLDLAIRLTEAAESASGRPASAAPMTAPCLTIGDVERLGPCPPALRRIRAALIGFNADPDHRFTAAQARAAGCTIWDLIWVAEKVAAVDEQVRRRFSHCLADFATRVLPVFEKRVPSDDRPRAAIDAARAAAAREAAFEPAIANPFFGAHAASNAALVAAAIRASSAADSAVAAIMAVSFPAAGIGRAFTRKYTINTDAVADDALIAADNPRAERAWQFDRLVAWLSDNPPEPLPLPPLPPEQAR